MDWLAAGFWFWLGWVAAALWRGRRPAPPPVAPVVDAPRLKLTRYDRPLHDEVQRAVEARLRGIRRGRECGGD
jgi:hypothetical protein